MAMYENAREMIGMISRQFHFRAEFCSAYRIHANFLKLLYVDLMRLYRICYFSITQSYSQLHSMSLDQTLNFSFAYKSFANVTEEVKRSIEEMSKHVCEPLPATLNYFKVICDHIHRWRKSALRA